VRKVAAAVALLLAHLNAIVFSAGGALVGYGMSRWSAPAACVLLGSILMLAAAWPYLGPPRKKNP
jgi:hypothetical protein